MTIASMAYARLLIPMGAGILLSFVLLWAWRWWRARPGASALLTYLRLAGLARLSWGEAALLWRIARQQELPTPITLLVSRSTLGRHARAYARQPGVDRAAVLRRAASLRRRLFEPWDAAADAA